MPTRPGPDEIARRVADARRLGYRIHVRQHPAAQLEVPDWAGVVTTPDERTLFPDALADEESAALLQALTVIDRHIAAHTGRTVPREDGNVRHAR